MACTAMADRFTVKFWLNLQMMAQYCAPSLAVLLLMRGLLRVFPRLRNAQRAKFVSRRCGIIVMAL